MGTGFESKAVDLPGEGQLLHDCAGSWIAGETCLTVWKPGSEPEFESLSFEAFQRLSHRAAGWMTGAGVGIGDTVIKVIPKQTAEQGMHYTNMIEPKVRDLIKQ